MNNRRQAGLEEHPSTPYHQARQPMSQQCLGRLVQRILRRLLWARMVD
jgi:hypothetical protein